LRHDEVSGLLVDVSVFNEVHPNAALKRRNDDWHLLQLSSSGTEYFSD